MRNENETTSGDAVRIFRAAKNWSQETLATEARVTRETVSRIERGGTPSTGTARALAQALGCEVELLIP